MVQSKKLLYAKYFLWSDFLKLRKTVYSSILAFIILFSMVVTANVFNNQEIIFPEVAALCAGMLLAPKHPWSVSKPRLVIIMTICSVAGLLLSISPLWLIVKIMLGFCVAVCCMFAFRSSLVPSISACVLPILMETKSIIYPISVIILSVCIVLAQLFLEKKNLRQPKTYVKTQKVDFSQVMYWLILLLCVSVYSIFPVLSGKVLLIAPPLIVMFCEMMSSERKFFHKEGKTCFFVIIMAAVGSISNYITYLLNIPTFVCALFVSVFVIVFMNLSKFYFPPAAALAFLPFIINKELLLWYTLFIGITAIVCSVVSALSFHFADKISDIKNNKKINN